MHHCRIDTRPCSEIFSRTLRFHCVDSSNQTHGRGQPTYLQTGVQRALSMRKGRSSKRRGCRAQPCELIFFLDDSNQFLATSLGRQGLIFLLFRILRIRPIVQIISRRDIEIDEWKYLRTMTPKAGGYNTVMYFTPYSSENRCL